MPAALRPKLALPHTPAPLRPKPAPHRALHPAVHARLQVREKDIDAQETDLDNEGLLMDPDDDPLLLHAEILDGDSDADEDLDGDGIGDQVINEQDFIMNARFLLNKVYYR